jgi:hypothetical protein
MTGRVAMRVALIAVIAAAHACKKKPDGAGPPAAVTGIAAIPADAEVVVSFDVGRLAGSPLVGRAVDLMLQRDDTLRARWARVAAACQIDPVAQIRRVVLALGPRTKTGQAGLMVVSGDLAEATLATCMKTAVGTGGGEVTARSAGGRTIYAVTEAARTVWFGFGQADTVVLGSNEAWLEQAFAGGPTLADSGALKPLIARADQAAPMWAAGLAPAEVTAGLVKSTGGALKRGPSALFLSVDPSTGLRVELGADLASEDDAKIMEEFIKGQLPGLSLFAQIRALGPLVAKITTQRAGTHVTVGLSLAMDEVNQLLQAIDRPAEDPQDSAPAVAPAPAQGSGSASK